MSSYRNEDDLTIKLTEIILVNAIIKTGLSKGVATQSLMVSLQAPLQMFLLIIRAGTMGISAISGSNVHQCRNTRHCG